MDINTGEIQPAANWQLPTRDFQQKEVQSVTPVAKAEGGSVAETKADNADNADVDSGAQFQNSEFEAEASRMESFFRENFGIELGFAMGAEGETFLEIRDKKSGKMIRRLPAKKLAKLREKKEDLRGILFDSQA